MESWQVINVELRRTQLIRLIYLKSTIFFYSCLGIVNHVKGEEGGEMAEEYEEDFGKTSIN